MASVTDSGPLVEICRLKKYFPVDAGLLSRRPKAWLKAVDDVSFTIRHGSTFGLVGESGCGKTTTAKIVLGVETATAGEIRFRGTDIVGLTGQARKAARSSFQAVFQNPYGSLDPRMRIGASIAEPLVASRLGASRDQTRQAVRRLLTEVGLDITHASAYPHELSGGMCQRVAIARALAPSPQLIVLDEPVSSLDVSIRGSIMNLLKDLQQQHGMSYLLIAHDLATVRYMSDRLGIMYLGKLVEEGESEEIFNHPSHPYTKALMNASLPATPGSRRAPVVLSGEMPSPIDLPSGCRFHTRCVQVMPVCSESEPILKTIGAEHQASCHLCT